MLAKLITGVVALALIGCGGDDGGGETQPDSKVFEDAPPMQIDAPVSTQMGIGQPCTPTAGGGAPQGDCPTGYECLMLNGGNGNWCSKTCTRGTGDQCSVGYVGPGIAQCIFDIMTPNNPTRQFCGVICMDTTGSCPATKCDGMCAGTLTCSANLTNMGGMVTGKACF
ncbi:MAG: hypothetical protein H0T89_13165 [Deltaproteobacteria bacterium]|nr:hypothetical protein [Deltaproteobacteria bacterium]MDQ3295770.1 hypothetical protein [Myxococcota bacterium]